MKCYTADRETGTFIDECASKGEAKRKIDTYEAFDKVNGIYEENFYDIVNEHHESIL